MVSCVRNIRAKNCQNLKIGFQVTVDNVGDFLRHSVDTPGKLVSTICYDMQQAYACLRLFLQ